ncbi:MAG: shikimate dehydrogenase [Ghiorsea sp.]
MVDINGKTSLYGIIGDPITHSLSPLFQNYFIKNIPHNAVYLPFHVESSSLEQALHGLHATHTLGINVTVPHKESVLSMVDADDDSLVIGAVNTLKRSHTGWLATNTDWQGFAAVLHGLQADVTNTPVLLFGAGGTSRAVFHALHHQGATEVWICNRSSDRAEKLAAELEVSYPSVRVKLLAWTNEAVLQQSKSCKVVINTSSIGLQQNDIFPFELQGAGMAIDAVYKPNGSTAFGRIAEHGGYAAVDGLPMLIAQGIASFEFWHQEHIKKSLFTLPDKLRALQWVEQQLGRQSLNMPGWRA